MASLVTNVTQTMLGISFEPAGSSTPAPQLTWRTAMLPIPGKHPLTVGLSSDEGGCIKLAAAMFSSAPEAVDSGMMSDALCELVNMTAGLLKSTLALDQALGLPRIVNEQEVRTAEPSAASHVTVLRAKEMELVLWIVHGVGSK